MQSAEQTNYEHLSWRAAPRVLGDGAVWPGLYAVGTLGLLALIAGLPIGDVDRWRAVLSGAFVLLCAQGGYLLDRAKVSATRLDPADRAANPSRFRLFDGRGRAIRVFVIVELAAAAAVALFIEPWLALVPIGTGIGVTLYAGRPANTGHPRPKDLAFLKGPLIASAHLALAGAALGAIFGRGTLTASPTWVAAVCVWLIVLGDATVCDLDDADSDRAFGTRSVPVLLGERSAWGIAWACAVGASGLAWLNAGQCLGVPLALCMGSTLVIAMLLPSRKDFIDARLIAITAVCIAFA